MDSIDLNHELSRIDDHWSPRIITSLNGQDVKVATFLGAYHWHAHSDADELFLVLKGCFTMEFRDRTVNVSEGQIVVVPQGVEHRPVADAPCSVLLFEPTGLVSTGDM